MYNLRIPVIKKENSLWTNKILKWLTKAYFWKHGRRYYDVIQVVVVIEIMSLKINNKDQPTKKKDVKTSQPNLIKHAYDV